jgi:ABC-type bacteriocin/lantibiotic exporter with double-glycine peptidase domain
MALAMTKRPREENLITLIKCLRTGSPPFAAGIRFIFRGFGWPISLATGVGILLNVFIGIVNPLGLKVLFDSGIAAHSTRTFLKTSVFLLAAFTLWRACDFLHDIYVQRIKGRILQTVVCKLLTAYFALPFGQVRNKDTGYFLSRVLDEPSLTVVPLVDSVVGAAVAISSVIVGSLVAVRLSWRAAVLVALIAPGAYVLGQVFGGRLMKESHTEQDAQASVRGTFLQAISAFRTVLLFGLSRHVEEQAQGALSEFVTAQERRYISSYKYKALSGLLLSYAEMSVIVVAGYQVLQNQMTFGAFMGFMNAFWIATRGAKQVFESVPDIFRLNALSARLLAMATPHAVSASSAGSPPAGAICSMDQLCLGYGDGYILKNVDLELRSHDRVLVTGRNGAGKSTLCLALAGLLVGDKGLSRTLLRDDISAAIAPFEFPPGTIRDTLAAIASSQQQLKKMERLARELGIINSLDQQAAALSAGQKKKCEVLICVAKEANLYIFDEPLAGIDVNSKYVVMDVVERETKGKALVIVMHGDKEFFSRFTRSFILEYGQLREVATAALQDAV